MTPGALLVLFALVCVLFLFGPLTALVLSVVILLAAAVL